MLFFNQLKAQAINDTINKNSIYESKSVEVMPEFPGGNAAFYKFISRNYRIPNVKGLRGNFFVSYVIEVDGSLSDIKVLRDLGSGTGEEAVRVLKLSPLWKPGELNGIKVKVKYSLPISLGK